MPYSPHSGRRRYTYDNQTKSPTNVEQWFFDVESSSHSGEVKWLKSWDANDLRVPRPSTSSAQRVASALSPLDPHSLRELALSWRTNHTLHAEFRARAFGKAPVSPRVHSAVAV
jgi:hypothetical protein